MKDFDINILKKEIETICKVYLITPNIDKYYMNNKNGYWETREGYRNDVATTIGFINTILDEYQENLSAISYSLSTFIKANEQLSFENKKLEKYKSAWKELKELYNDRNYDFDYGISHSLLENIEIKHNMEKI